MRLFLRFTLFVAVLFALASSAHAQATGSDCSTADQPTKTWNQQPPDGPTAPNCNGTYKQSFTVYSTTVDTCTNNNTGSVYLQGVRQTTGIGYWSAPTAGAPFCSNSVTLKCNPNITQEVTHATSGSDYNRFYLRAWDDNGAGAPSPCTTVARMSRQDFWQCQGVDCPPPPPDPTCPHPTCACDPNTPDPCCCGGSPILIDIGGQGFNLTNAPNGVRFDISGKGNPFQIAWTAPGANNAFLCLPDSSGGCNSGKQLFGNFTPQPSSSSPNGFAALAVYDQPASGGNGDGVIDSKDAVFNSLRLWIDTNHDVISQPNELFTLPSLGVNSISLNYKLDERQDQYGNTFRYRAQVNPNGAAGVGRLAYDVFFVMLFDPNSAKTKGCVIPKALRRTGGK